MLLRFAFIILVLSLVSCVVYTKPDETEKPRKFDMTNCEEPRPQICTREFRPVCGLQDSGQYKTYSTACEACSHKQVTSYYKGVCR